MVNRSVLILAFALAWMKLSDSQFCPGISHCIKTHPSCIIEGISSEECLNSTVDKLRYSNHDKVIFNNITLPGLPARIFGSLRLTKLVFLRYNIKSLNLSSVSPFEGATTLRTLRFLQPQSNMKDWSYEHLGGLQLTELTFSQAERKFFGLKHRLPEDFKKAGKSSIKKLEISSSCLSYLDDNSLSTFVNVEIIRLVGNELTTINRNVFPDSPYLKTIDLSFNMIRYLVPHAFWNPNLPSLTEIFLQRNHLVTIEESVLPVNARKFYLNGNKELYCNKDLVWLLKKDLSIWQGGEGEPAICNTPDVFRGCPMVNLTVDEFRNGRLSEDSNCKKGVR